MNQIDSGWGNFPYHTKFLKESCAERNYFFGNVVPFFRIFICLNEIENA